ARVVGRAILGLALAWVGEGWCFFVYVLSFLAVIVDLLMMRIDRTEIRPSEGSPLKSIIQGFHFAMRDVPVRSALLLLSVLSLFGLQYSVFMPIYASQIMKGGKRMRGMRLSVSGADAFLAV